jgi:hypothetical protein
MSWNIDMAYAYTVGVEDGKAGKRRGRPNDFEACYEQGWQHAKRERVSIMLQVWDKARDGMLEYLLADATLQTAGGTQDDMPNRGMI